jgi:serine/threonine protein kinase
MIGQALGKYRVVEKLGEGGMGIVYRAQDEELSRNVAVKILPPGVLTDEVSRKRFRKEALTLAKLNHPNIESLYDLDNKDGVDFLVMEYVPGATLAERLAGGALPEKEVLTLGMQVAAALEEAHDQGVVHRDLKPGNIGVTPKGQVKVLDFGLAKVLPQAAEVDITVSLTETPAMAGTLPYMPPELLRGEPTDTRADIYSLGVVLYEMSTGQRPFPRAVGPALNRRHPAPTANRTADVERAGVPGTGTNHPEVYGKGAGEPLPICQRVENRLGTTVAEHCGGGPRALWISFPDPRQLVA